MNFEVIGSVSTPAPSPTISTCDHGLLLTIIAISLTVVAALLFYIIFFRKDYSIHNTCPAASPDSPSSCPKLLRRDFYYIVTIFSTVIIFVLTHLYVGEDDAMNYFSFASTITSIVLSVLAIIMTLSSESKSEKVKDSIDSSVKQLEQATIKTSEYVTKIEEQSNAINDILIKADEILIRTKNLESDVDEIRRRNLSKQEHQGFEANKGGYA